MMPSPLDMEHGYGIITQITGPPIGFASVISYICTIVLPSGTHEGVAGIVPNCDRFAAPLEVRAHVVGTTFSCVKVLGRIQAHLPPELPHSGPCA